jgi:hypothetical protein
MRLGALVVIAACGGEAAPPLDACRPGVVFLNRAGGTYLPGLVDDAVANRSVLIDAERVVAPYSHDDVTWQSTVACIREGLARLPIEITENDPGAITHVEIVFTTTYWDGSPGTTSIIPDSCRPGHQIEFVFGDALPTDAAACQTALAGFAKMTALLSTTGDCRDFLDRSQDCVPMREFVDETIQCVDVTNQPAPCRCGGTDQNSFQRLLATFPACD